MAAPKVEFQVTLTGGTWIDGSKEFAIRYTWESNGETRTYRTVGHSKAGAIRSAEAHNVTAADMRAALIAAGVK